MSGMALNTSHQGFPFLDYTPHLVSRTLRNLRNTLNAKRGLILSLVEKSSIFLDPINEFTRRRSAVTISWGSADPW
jgi:hypothetical protein